MFRIEADQFAALRKHKLAEALAASFTGNPWRGAVDPASGEVLATDRLGHASRYGFDAQGYIGSITSPLGRTWQLHNGPKGRLDGLTNPAGLTIGFDYDANYGRLTGIRRGEQAPLRIGYDERGKPAELAYPDGSRTRFDFAADRLTARTDRLGQCERYDYDAAGRLTAITNGNGQTTTFDYGEWDRPARACFPDGRIETYRYDPQGRLIALADAAGPIADLTYDGDSTRLARIVYGDGEELRYRYDEAGHVLAADCPAAKTTFVYNAEGALIGETLDDASVGYRYDARGSLTELRYPDGSTVGFGYDADQRIARIADWSGAVSVWDYRDEQVTRLAYANGCHLETRHDRAGLIAELALTAPGGAPLAHSRYARDSEDRLVAADDRRFGRRDYRYDLEGRLLGVTAASPQQAERFASDAAGNRTHCTGATASFDVADRLLQQGDTHCRYDARGELEQLSSPAGTWRFTWSRRGLLTGALSERGQELDFGYDAFGRRVWKRVTEATGQPPRITRYWWAGEHLIAELTWQGAQVLRRQHYAFLPGGYTPFATRIDGAPYYYHCDPLGTPKRLTDAMGRLVWEADHRAFGEALIVTAQIHNPWRLPGQYHDPETGLHYNRFRYYAPVLGRYLSRDPLTFLAGTNFFAYVDGDPINQADPLGLWWKAALSIAAGVAVAALVLMTAPVSLPLIAAAAVVGVGTAVGVNKVLNLKEFCFSCALSAFVDGFVTGAGFALAAAFLPAEAVVGLSVVAVYSILQEHFGWKLLPWEDDSKSYFEKTGAEQSESLGGLTGMFAGGAVVGGYLAPRTRIASPGGSKQIGEFVTQPNEAVFWSGKTKGVGGSEIAAKMGGERGSTLESLIQTRNIEMPPWNPADPSSVAAWGNASKAFAQGASGEVKAVIGQQLRPGNIWETVELPALKANPSVTKIIQVDPATGVETVIFNR